MKVTLVDFTGAGSTMPDVYAANVLIFAKSTRLNMTPDLLTKVTEMTEEQRKAELEYIANTIPASHEFVHYTFLIEGVTRAFTHQLVRSRQFSYAQQTMRVLNVEGWEYATGPTITNDRIAFGEERSKKSDYDSTMEHIDWCYKELIKNGAAIEDARGILPTNILTNIMMSGNLRNFCDLIRKRSSPRTQGEYREVLTGMKSEMLRVHPFTKMFIDRTFDQAASDLDDMIKEFVGQNPTGIKMLKLVDQMRTK